MKFLWDTLNHYLLLMSIARTLWKEKLMTSICLAYLSYFMYFRQMYFMDPITDKIWIKDITNKYDRKLRVMAKEAVKRDVFGNEQLPAKVAPLLVDLVQMPKIKSLMTDLFIILLKNKAFQADTDRLVSRLIHDYLLSLDCQRKFSTLIVEQVFRNQETVLPGLYRLLQNYLLGDNQAMLTAHGESVLLNVLQINAVSKSAVDSIMKESHSALESPKVLGAAVNAAISNMGQQKK